MFKAVLMSLAIFLASMSLANAQAKHVGDLQIIDASLSKTKLSPAKKAEVVRLRNKGEKLHYEGRHGKAEVVLEKAKALLQTH
jgi:hypothetical protein